MVQSTIAKDLRDLNIEKKDGVFRGGESRDDILREELQRLVNRHKLDFTTRNGVCYIRFADGYSLVVKSLLLQLQWKEVFAALVDDDLLTIICRDEASCHEVLRRLVLTAQ